MSQLQRTAELLRQAAAELEEASTSTTSTSTRVSTGNEQVQTPVDPVCRTTQEIRRLFSPYPPLSRRTGSRPSIPVKQVKHLKQAKWSHKFYCLADPNQDTVPDRNQRKLLSDAALGENKITMTKNKDPNHFMEIILSTFPRLQDGGGFELLRSTSRVSLEVINPPGSGYTSQYLMEDCHIGAAIIYIRPLQRELDLTPTNSEIEPDANCPLEDCLICGLGVPVIAMRNHIEECHKDESEDIPSIKKRKTNEGVQTTICQFHVANEIPCPICGETFDADHKLEVHEATCGEKETVNRETGMGVCPICQKGVSLDMLATHAAGCDDSRHSLDTSPVDSHQPISEQHKLRSVKECLDDLYQGLSDVKPWTVTVVRRKFLQTAMEQLEDASEEEWGSLLSVRFIGEEGVDAGGPKREFFTLLFKESDVFEMKSLSLDPHLMDKGTYRLMGKAVALSAIYGHPGPRCLSKEITSYILEDTIPDFSEMDARDIQQADVIDLVNKIEEATETNIEGVYQNGFSLIEPTGYKHRLTMGKKHELINALKAHYSFYRVLGPLIQFVDGLKSFGVLEFLRKDPASKKYFLHGTFSSAEEIVLFFKPKFSEDPTEKEVEEVVVYNFTKFVKRTERHAITSNVINLEDGAENQIVITTGHLLNALVGSSMLPTNISLGSILFDHTSNSLPSVNTCLPSILFSQTKQLLEYDRFEECLKLIIVGAPDFGMV